MVGPVMQALLVSTVAASTENGVVHDQNTEDVGGYVAPMVPAAPTDSSGQGLRGDSIQPMPTRALAYGAPDLPAEERRSIGECDSSLGDEFGMFDIDDDFALPPPALDLDASIFETGRISMFGSSDVGLGAADEDGGEDTVQLSALAMAAHLESLQLAPDSAGNTRCPSPELATLATEATEETEYQESVLEACAAILRHQACCAQRHRSESGAFLPCGAAVRVGRRRVAARPPRQMGLAARRTAAPSCGLPLRAGASRRQPQQQQRSAAH